MKKTLWIIGIIVVIGLIVWGINTKFSDDSKTSNQEVFKIGIILPLSGPAAVLGEASQKSVDLALSKLSPGELSKIEIVYGDDQFDPKQTVSVAQKLIDIDKVSTLITYSSPSSVAASYIAEKNAVPMIGLGNSSEVNIGKQWAIRFMLGPEAQAEAIESLLLRNTYKRIALLWNLSDGPKSVHDALLPLLSNHGYVVVADESVTKTENDFRTSIAKIKAAKPDVIVVYISPQIGVFGKQFKDDGASIPIVSGPTFEIVDQLIAAQGGLDNHLFVGANNVSFVEDYYKSYGLYPTIAGDYIYDAVMEFIHAANETDGSNTEVIKFIKKNFTGIAGNYVYNGDGSFDVKQVVKKWNGNGFEVVR